MAAEWTPAQKDAIEASGRAIYVSAAAGSGKTAVLVEKLCRLLTDEKNPLPADKIVVVTFTNDAAAQMKRRLSKELTRLLEEQPHNRMIASQLELIPAAKISTIHSFCFNLIRENAGPAGVDPSFAVLTPEDENVIVSKAVTTVTDKWFRQERNDIRRLTEFFCPGENSERHFAEIIPILRKKILALPFPEDVMDSYTKWYQSPPDPENDMLIAAYAEYVRGCMSHAADLLCAVRDSINGGDDPISLALTKEWELVSEASDKMRSGLKEVFDDAPALSFMQIKTIPAKLIPKNAEGKTDTELQKALLKIRNRAIEICGDLCPVTITNSEGFPIETNEAGHFFTLAHVAEDYRIHGEICCRLFRMMKDVFAEEKRLKGVRNGLGFNDAEQIACSLLCEKKDGRTVKSPLAEELSKSFGVVMIDEFQDSTAVQELIFRMLSKDGCAEAAGTNFFAVGDIKQSIYRFRCADPSLFKADLEQSADYNSEDDRDGRSARILLSKNFRSSRNVVDTVNMVFDDIMSERTGGVQYGKSDRLIFGASLPDDMGPVEIINIGEVPKAGSRTVNADYCRHEAALAAGRIKQLLDTETITEDGEKRPLRPSDICILLRKTGNAEYYISALKRLGIDCCGGRENGFIDSGEIITVTDLLRAADNPSLDIPMTAVLMSPMFMFTAEDMARIRTASAGTVFSGIAAVANGTAYDDEGLYPDGFIQRCRSFYSYFLELRSFAVCRSTEELIRHIYDTTDFVSVMSVLDEDGTHKNNLRRLLTLAASYDNTSANGLSGFVRMLDSMQESGSDLKTESSAAGANAVAIKTIHSSKGLEYPVVFLCDIWSEFHDDEPKSFRRAADNTVFCPQFGTGFRISRKDPDTGGFTSYESFPERAIRTVLSRSSADEEMMILYVALTRAKNKLIITRRSDPSAAVRRRCAEVLRSGMGKQINSVLFGSSAEDWLDTVFCTENAEAAAGDGFVETVNPWDIPLPDAADDASDEGSEERDISEEFARLMSCGYDSDRAGLSAKLTVTELAKGGRSDAPTGGRFFDKTETDAPKGISAAERGTAVHAFMQNADMSVLRAAGEKGLADAVKKEADRMCRMGLISKRQGECISPKMIGGFVRCGLFERMADSDEIIRERKFLVKISDLCLDDSGLNVYNGTEGMLQGVADCIFREKDGYVLVDYKTDRNVTEEMLTDRYEKQLRLYAAAFSLILDAPVKKAYIYSFCLSKEIEIKIN